MTDSSPNQNQEPLPNSSIPTQGQNNTDPTASTNTANTASNTGYWGNPPQTPFAQNYQNYPYQTQFNQNGSYTPPTPPNPPIAKPKKKTSSWIAALIIGVLVVILAVVGGCTACSVTASVISDMSNNNYAATNDQDNSSLQNSYTKEELNEDLRYRYSLDDSNEGGSITKNELDSIDSILANESNNATNLRAGVYYVGSTLDPGSYWVEGTNNNLTYYFLLSPSDSSNSNYDVALVNNYYGHNIVEVSEGEVLVIENKATPLEQFSQTFSSPYGSGVYRVGTDVPAGTYTLSAGKADDYYAYYVMSNLSYDDNSYLEKETYMMLPDKQPTITLKEGTYIELYNLSMRPANEEKTI